MVWYGSIAWRSLGTGGSNLMTSKGIFFSSLLVLLLLFHQLVSFNFKEVLSLPSYIFSRILILKWEKRRKGGRKEGLFYHYYHYYHYYDT